MWRQIINSVNESDRMIKQIKDLDGHAEVFYYTAFSRKSVKKIPKQKEKKKKTREKTANHNILEADVFDSNV